MNGVTSADETSKPHLKRLARHVPPEQFVRYLLVGGWNTLFGYGAFAFFTMILEPRMRYGYIVASLIANILAISVSFLGYKWFVFKTKGNYIKEWFKCLMVYSASIVLGLVMLPPAVFLVTAVTHNPTTAPYIAGAILLGFNVIISFIGHKKFSFRDVRRESVKHAPGQTAE